MDRRTALHSLLNRCEWPTRFAALVTLLVLAASRPAAAAQDQPRTTPAHAPATSTGTAAPGGTRDNEPPQAGTDAAKKETASRDAAAKQRVRVIKQWLNPPLRARLLPDDDIVVVERLFPAYAMQVDHNMSRDDALRFAVNYSEAVVVVEVEQAAGELAERDTWLRTRATAVLREIVVPAPQLGATRGGKVVVVEDGGEMIIDGKTVRTEIIAEPMRPRGHYLMFVIFNPDPDGVSYPLVRFEVMEDGTLRDPLLDREKSEWPKTITGMTLADALKGIAKFAAEKSAAVAAAPSAEDVVKPPTPPGSSKRAKPPDRSIRRHRRRQRYRIAQPEFDP